VMKQLFINLDDPNLAYFAEGMVRPGESGGCYVCEPVSSLPDASAL
jgi:hypothetical protein